ncbi:hypothetical protein F2P56_014448 [Juglans regia]|uniref:Uncharacterized protein n=1 Tax=Juglans regia TaxID=51240 RepID=A0A833XDC5_JUGRE|nr:hypothetical protein F2P56_014448 [Juglans regia]
MEVMATLGHHPEHFRILVLAQADRTRRTIGTHVAILAVVRELGVRVDDALVDPDGDVLIKRLSVFVLGDKDYAGKDDTVTGVGVMTVVPAVVDGVIGRPMGATAKV